MHHTTSHNEPRLSAAGLALALALSAALPASAATAPPLATVGNASISVEDVRTQIEGEPTEDAVLGALQVLVDELLLRAEAQKHLPPAQALQPNAPEHLLSTLFSPNALCRELPEGARRHWFEETIWRFRMPPAWRVSAIGWTCCRGSGCEHPDAVACLTRAEAAIERLSAELPDHGTDEDFGAAFKAVAPTSPRLRFERYTFFGDPKSPAEKIHRRLRTADKAIVQAVSAARVGQITGPVATPSGRFILRLREKRPRVDLRWEDARTQAILRTELCPRLLSRVRRQYMSDLRTQLPVRIDQNAVRAAFGFALTGAAPR